MTSFKVVSYNVVASFSVLEDRDQTPDKRHSWAFRNKYVKEAIERQEPDVICLQEMAQEQAFELAVYFGSNYESFFLSQCPSDIEAGIIARGEEVKEWIGKYVGTALTGIFVKNGIEILDQGRFWFNENPLEVPTSKDRGTIDKGFGNMNTPRAEHWVKLLRDEHIVFVFNSHYPLSGDVNTRTSCAKLERKMIDEITDGKQFVSVGDRNFIDDGWKDSYGALTEGLIDPFRHAEGLRTTWLGFSYDKFQTRRNPDRCGVDNDKKLDVPITNMSIDHVYVDMGAIDPKEEKLLPIDKDFDYDYQNDGRYFASDHALIGLWLTSKYDRETVMKRLRPLYYGHELEKDIEENLSDCYMMHNRENGFLSIIDENVPGLGEKHLYFPYLTLFLKKRCVRLYLTYVGKREMVHNYVSIRIYEGYCSNFEIEGGKMTYEILDEGPAFAEYEWNSDSRKYIDDWITNNGLTESYDKSRLYTIILLTRKYDERDSDNFQRMGEENWVKVVDGNLLFKYIDCENGGEISFYNGKEFDYELEQDW